MGAVTKAVIASIKAAGFMVEVGYTDELPVFIATDERTGERFVVRGSDLCETVCEPAVQVGIAMDDG